MREGYVVCVVERVRVETLDNGAIFIGPPTFILYITAHRLAAPEEYPFLRQSPRATLDRFVGYKDAPDAPDWMQWSEPSAIFQQRADFFSKLFKKMASWKVHTNQPGLPLAMVVWARSADISQTLWPEVPTTPLNQRKPENTRTRKSLRLGAELEESPTQARCVAVRDMEPVDSEETESFVPRSIDFRLPIVQLDV